MMDELGIYAQILYPNVVGFGGQKFDDVIDPELKMLCATIFNDAMAEIQDQSGQRMFPMALCRGGTSTARCARSSARASLGLRGVNTNADPHNEGCPRPRRASTGTRCGRCAPTSACR